MLSIILSSLALLHVVINLLALHRGAHDRSLPDPALHLPLSGEVHDDGEVDDGHGGEDGEGLAEA